MSCSKQSVTGSGEHKSFREGSNKGSNSCQNVNKLVNKSYCFNQRVCSTVTAGVGGN